LKGKGSVQPKPEPDQQFRDAEFCRLVLQIIAELSPCPEPTLFVVAGTHGLQRFTNGSLEELGKLLGKCLEELKARGLVEEVEGSQLVIVPARSAVDDILDLKANLELQPQATREKLGESAEDQDILVLTAENELQPQSMRQAFDRPIGCEDILDLPTKLEVHEDEHILDLTAQAPRPSKLDKPTNQQFQTKDTATGSPKRAPEPTREEIIDAMRRFISDD
jgi:hypothetical protein